MVPFFLDSRYKLDHNFGPKNIYLSFIGEMSTSAHNRKLFSSFFYQSSCVCKENVDGADCSRCKNRTTAFPRSTLRAAVPVIVINRVVLVT